MKKINKFLMIASPFFFLMILFLAFYFASSKQPKLSIQSNANLLPTTYLSSDNESQKSNLSLEQQELKLKISKLSADLEKINFQDEYLFPPNLDFEFVSP